MELGSEFYAGRKYPMAVFKKILNEFKAYLYFLATWFPGALGYRLRYLVYKNHFKACGREIDISLGSVLEVQNQIIAARDVGLINSEEFNSAWNQTVTTQKVINGLIRSIRSSMP